MLSLFIPIGIIVDLADHIDNIIKNKAPLSAVIQFYLDFIIYFANLLFPLFLFLSVIWFTSKLANKTEIIAILSSGVSFWRFLRPYIIGATIICFGALLLTLFLAPKASKGFNEFTEKYIRPNRKTKDTRNVYRKINDNEYIYAQNFAPISKSASNFTLEHFKGNDMVFKISARKITFIEKDSIFELRDYVKRTITPSIDYIRKERKFDTILPFNIEELTPSDYKAETLSVFELSDFIEKENQRGSSDLNRYKIVAYKRWSIPISAYILTIIGVAVSSMKRRGGMGINLALGIVLAFSFIFMDKVLGTISSKSSLEPWIAVWTPNILFSILAAYLLFSAKR